MSLFERKNTMKVLGINGSPRPKGNTYSLIQSVFHVLEKEGINTELFQVGGKNILSCIGCRKCFESKDNTCPTRKGDLVNELMAKMVEADGLLQIDLGDPQCLSDQMNRFRWNMVIIPLNIQQDIHQPSPVAVILGDNLVDFIFHRLAPFWL